MFGGLAALAIIVLRLCAGSDSCRDEMCADHVLALQVSFQPAAASSLSKAGYRAAFGGLFGVTRNSSQRRANAAGDLNLMNCSQATGASSPGFCSDANGRACFYCGHPGPQFPEYSEGYIYRTDCGGAMDDDNYDRPLVTFTRPQSQNFLPPKYGPPTGWTNAYCELNNQVASANAEANHDYFYFATTFVMPPGESFDFWYCKYNGYLEDAFVKTMRNYDALYEQSAAVCAARDAEFNLSSITLRQVQPLAEVALSGGRLTPKQARFASAYTCAMGGPGPDIAYCAYTYRDLGDEKFCYYPSGPGWKGTIYEGTAEAERWQCPKDH